MLTRLKTIISIGKTYILQAAHSRNNIYNSKSRTTAICYNWNALKYQKLAESSSIGGQSDENSKDHIIEPQHIVHMTA